MGNAGVAIVDDGEAVHLNPAGLTQIGWKGNFQPLDTLGYRRNRVDFWMMGVGFDPSPEILLQAWRFYDRNDKTIKAAQKDPTAVLKDNEFLNEIYKFDRLPIPVRTNLDMMLAVHNYGAAFWTQDDITLQLDRGALVPKAAVDLRSVSALELATARAFLDDRLSLGFGYRVVSQTSKHGEYNVISLKDSAQKFGTDMALDAAGDLRRSEDWGHGIDLGFLWFQTPNLRFGGAIQNVGMKQGKQFVTPNLALGVAWAPTFLQSNRTFSRKFNLALSLDDLLQDTLGYKPLSRVNVGGEYEMTFIPHVLVGRLAGGLQGGYPSFGASGTLFTIFRGDFLTYAEEGGYFTGDKEVRYYMMRAGIGF